MDRILRVNLTTGAISFSPVPSAYRYLGGRALTSRIVCDEVDPTCDPLGPHNKLVWATGLMSGTTTSSANRLSLGCKSPMTGGIKESNAGGETGILLAQAGYKAVVVEGAAVPGTWWVLVVDADGARLEPALPESIGEVGSLASAQMFFEHYGKNCALALCGPCGEMRMMIAGVASTDRELRPTRMAARGAVGAVMGSKGLKALVVLGNLRRPVAAVDPDLWKSTVRTYNAAIRQDPGTSRRYPEFGTAITLEHVNKLGGLPTRNFSNGQFEGADAISGIHMRDLILERGGEGMITHSCMTGCAIRCSNVFADEKGREVTSSLEFETNTLLGSNLGIDSFDTIARLTRLCNDLGTDTIETGAALGVAMEAGVLAWGDGEAAERILDVDVRKGTPLGRIIGSGAVGVGRTFGILRVPAVKGQALAAYDPRVIKGNGVTYCTSPMGGDHTAGNTVFAKTDHLDPSDKVRVSREAQILQTLIDTLGVCNFARNMLANIPNALVDFFQARTGVTWTREALDQLALTVIRGEVQFNRRAGLGPTTDRLPEWMRREPLPPHNALFDIPDADLDAIWDDDWESAKSHSR